ncbi:hypothetical protein SDC9_180457 [bioreactor metagenome]|uniref:Uncharacterized protein n=1 Tax=bioreactor metagenome TaxID=1076179 RepID=A0A645HA47_9ZZZZ
MAKEAMGTTLFSTGTALLWMDMAAISDIMMMPTNSKGCNCPICRFPMALMAIMTTVYKIKVRMVISNITGLLTLCVLLVYVALFCGG